MDNFNTVVNGGAVETDLVSDGWTAVLRKLGNRGGRATEDIDLAKIAEKRQLLDFEKMEQIRARVDEVVEDPERRARSRGTISSAKGRAFTISTCRRSRSLKSSSTIHKAKVSRLSPRMVW